MAHEKFSKIRFDGVTVTLEWTTQQGDETHGHALTCAHEPRPEFGAALQALAEDVIDVCELGELHWDEVDEDEEGSDIMRVRSVALSVNAKSGRRGVIVSALKSVKAANSPLVIQTPYLSEDADGDGEEKKGVAPAAMWERIKTLEVEAQAYLAGKRKPKAQLELAATG